MPHALTRCIIKTGIQAVVRHDRLGVLFLRLANDRELATRALPVGIGAVCRRNPSTALRYSAAAGDATLGELAEWDPKFAELFAPGALISASGFSERRDVPSKLAPCSMARLW